MNTSRQRKIDDILSRIAGSVDPETGDIRQGTGVAEPGDLFFRITQYPSRRQIRDVVDGMDWRSRMWVRNKTLLGFDRQDFDAWHVAIYIGGRKRKRHKRINLWVIHSTSERGVHAHQIVPRYFTNKGSRSRSRMEILTFQGITAEQRKTIVDFAMSKVNLTYDRTKWRHTFLTYLFGIPNVAYVMNQFSCQQLAIAAYDAAGAYFPHPYDSFPFCNIGRYLKRPLWHPKDRVDPRYPYLMDHHIYRDSRLVLKGAVYQNTTTDELILQTDNLEKYSWSDLLRQKYMTRQKMPY